MCKAFYIFILLPTKIHLTIIQNSGHRIPVDSRYRYLQALARARLRLLLLSLSDAQDWLCNFNWNKDHKDLKTPDGEDLSGVEPHTKMASTNMYYHEIENAQAAFRQYKEWIALFMQNSK